MLPQASAYRGAVGRAVVGRDAELESVRGLVRSARQGLGGALALVGAAGIGKSTLLAAAVAEVEAEESASVLLLAGAAAERDLPFAGLSALVRPLQRHIAALTVTQSKALAVALGTSDGPPPGRMELGGALLTLLAAHAEDGPVLVVVDDLQWLDRPSAELVVFAARRLQGERAAVLIGARIDGPAEGKPDSGNASSLAALLHGFPRIDLEGLASAVAGEMLPGTAAPVCALLAERTGGNPLAMLEAASMLPPEVRAGRLRLPRTLPPTSAAEYYRLRMASLSPAARAACRVAALAGNAPLDLLVRAMDVLHVGAGDLEPVEMAGLVRLTSDGPVWRHPLVRAAAAEGTTEEVRKAHAALAECWAGTSDGQSHWAWHVAEAVVGADERVADALASAAAVSAGRSAWIDAADAWERASELSVLAPRRRNWLGQAADAASRGGATARAGRLYDLALGVRTASAPGSEAHLWRERGRVEHVLGHPVRAYDMFMRAAGLTSGLDAVWAAGEAVFAAMYARKPDLALAAADWANAAADRSDPVQHFLALHASGAATALAGRPAAAAASLSTAMGLLLEQRLLEQHPDLLLWAVNAELFLSDAASELPAPVRAALARMRETGELMWSPRVVRLVAVRQYSGGAWGAAYAGFDHALELSRMSGQRTQVAEALLCLAAVEAARGEAELCTTHLDEAEHLLAGGEVRWLMADLWRARGMLQLSLGQSAAAVPCLERAVEIDPQALPDLVEALVWEGRREDARSVADLHALDTSDAAALVAAHLDSSPGTARHLLSTVQAASCFDVARARYAAAAILRRSGARREAREHLRAAADVFASLGAEPWQRRAEDELRACGATLRRQALGETLTPSERRVATLVAEGRPNKEVAAALFLSPKTVEFHLGRAYRKLGVTNRTALASRLAQAENA